MAISKAIWRVLSWWWGRRVAELSSMAGSSAWFIDIKKYIN
jgi:hypothetical protein